MGWEDEGNLSNSNEIISNCRWALALLIEDFEKRKLGHRNEGWDNGWTHLVRDLPFRFDEFPDVWSGTLKSSRGIDNPKARIACCRGRECLRSLAKLFCCSQDNKTKNYKKVPTAYLYSRAVNLLPEFLYRCGRVIRSVVNHIGIHSGCETGFGVPPVLCQ